MLALSLRAAEKAWLMPLPQNWNNGKDGMEVADDLVHEIDHSKIEYAFAKIDSTQAIKVTASQVELLTGRSIPLKAGMFFVLVRSEFGHGATGAYSVSSSDDGASLHVVHLSLGTPVKATKSAILVQLKKVPDNVYSSLSFAK